MLMQCGECKGSKVILDRMLGEYYCGGCGAVTEDSIADFSDLSFTFTGDEGSAHHSITSFLVAGKGLGTPAGDIMKQLKSLKGAYLESQTDHVERSFGEALPMLQVIWNCTALPLDLKIGSAMLYRKCIRKQLITGRRIEEMALAVVYNTCTAAEFERDFAKIAKELEASMENVHSYSKLIKNRTRSVSDKLYVEEHIRRGISELNLPETVSERALALGREIVGKRLELGKRPAVVAGAAICRASAESGERTRKSDVAKALGVSERSINRFLDSL